MDQCARGVMVFGVLIVSCLGAGGKDKKEDVAVSLWKDPKIEARELLYGAGGKKHAPDKSRYVFVEEVDKGITPKFIVRDASGVKWIVKVGEEARPETAATRLVWAVGYATDEDYFVPSQRVEEMPAQLRRGREYVSSDGAVRDGRWERIELKRVGHWRWLDNPFSDTRELDGLRVLMALINNYDMKDDQNSIYERDSVREYAVSDLGATFGRTGSRWPQASSKGDLEEYSRSNFITKVTDEYVDFAAPSWPMMMGIIPTPPLPYPLITAPMRLFGRPAVPDVAAQRWIGKGVPRAHVRWIAGMLRRLSSNQIRDAFRAAHYEPEQVEGFSRVVERRIADLGTL